MARVNWFCLSLIYILLVSNKHVTSITILSKRTLHRLSLSWSPFLYFTELLVSLNNHVVTPLLILKVLRLLYGSAVLHPNHCTTVTAYCLCINRGNLLCLCLFKLDFENFCFQHSLSWVVLVVNQGQFWDCAYGGCMHDPFFCIKSFMYILHILIVKGSFLFKKNIPFPTPDVGKWKWDSIQLFPPLLAPSMKPFLPYQWSTTWHKLTLSKGDSTELSHTSQQLLLR